MHRGRLSNIVAIISSSTSLEEACMRSIIGCQNLALVEGTLALLSLLPASAAAVAIVKASYTCIHRCRHQEGLLQHIYTIPCPRLNLILQASKNKQTMMSSLCNTSLN